MTNDIGLRLNNDKSKILTSIENTSPIKYIDEHLHTEINQCLQNFTNKKETKNGIKILGYPVGNKQYMHACLDETHTSVKKHIKP